MRKPNFVLDKPNSTEPTYIFLLITCKDGRLKLSTKERVLPTHFIGQRCIVPKTNKDKELQERYEMANIVLGNIEKKIKTLSNESKINGIAITKEVLSSHLNPLVGAANKKTSYHKGSFHSAIDEYIEACELGRILTKRGKKFSALSDIATQWEE